MFGNWDGGGEPEDGLIAAMDTSQGRACRSQRQMLALIADSDRQDVWQDSGARDMAHWLSMRYGISCWKARRWIRRRSRPPEAPSTL
jgi:hypothetical protein